MVRSLEAFSDRFQFSSALCRGLGIGHLQVLERGKDNLGNNQSGILLVIGRDDIPGRVLGAGRVQASLKRLHILLPVLPLMNVREAELPVLLRIINPLAESLALFVLREMEEDLDNLGAV